MRRWRRIGGGAALGAVIAAVLLALRWWPGAPLAAQLPHSTALYAQGGELLRLTLAPDDQYRLWVPLDQVSPALPQAVQAYEDRWFWWHPGVNPAALVRSAFATWGSGARQGGSTITMQLARRLYRIDSRSIAGKLRQIGAALWLEARHSKREILEAYLNVAPYGGNIEGVGAASLIYFHKRAQELALPEALALAVIPQNPRRRLPGGHGAAALAKEAWKPAQSNQPGSEKQPPSKADSIGADLMVARERLWRIWVDAHPQDQHFAADLALPLRVHTPGDLPWRAPHVTDALIAAHASGEVRTTIDWRMQDTVERMLRQYIEVNRNFGIRNAAALLVDASTMQVRASVGSADWFDAGIDGQVNGTQARRSPGSTLKPFIYALALDQGVLHPLTMLKDAPTAFGPFSPENFDGRFVGPISAQDALVRSRNVPAVAVAAKLANPNLYAFLQQAGVARMASEAHYGLALALGGGEISMEELARLYALLANRGVLQDLSYVNSPQASVANAAPVGGAVRLDTRSVARPDTPHLLSEEAAFITLDMLKRNPRPDTGLPAHPAVAWKTGTSWGFHDAWSAGVFGRHVLIVWIGNFDGSSNPAFIGVKAAAPLFFRIIDSLRSQHLDPGEMAVHVPTPLTRVEVCAASGDLPNAWCPERAMTWFIPGKSPIRVSRLHRPVFIDTRTGRAVCSESASTRREIYEFWPSDLMRLFREAGMPRRMPPALPDCTGKAAPSATLATAGDAPQIVSPLRGVTYTVRLAKPEPIVLRANRGVGGPVYWFADQGFLGRADAGSSLAWNAPRAGRYMLRVVDENGASDSREIAIEFVP